MACFPVSMVLPPPLDSAFGPVAERIIGGRFLAHLGRLPGHGFFPGSATQEDFQDISIGIGNTRLYILYLKFHNTISARQLLVLSTMGMLNIPDLATHNPSRAASPRRAEFYEIKPNSPSGLAAGAAKISSIRLMNSAISLPYRAGTRWSPDEKILLARGPVLGANLEVFFHFKRVAPGLIVYEICVDGELEKLALAVLLAALTIILILLLRGRRPLPMPMPTPAMA